MDLTATRMPEMMSTDRADLDGVFASCVVGHIAYLHNGEPMVMPTVVVRYRDGIIVHGSTGSRWMRAVAGGVPVAVSVTALDGVVVARSAVPLFTAGSPRSQELRSRRRSMRSPSG